MTSFETSRQTLREQNLSYNPIQLNIPKRLSVQNILDYLHCVGSVVQITFSKSLRVTERLVLQSIDIDLQNQWSVWMEEWKSGRMENCERMENI